MDAAVFHGLWTGALLVIFIGIVLWAWSSKRKRGFEEAASLPLDDDDGPENFGSESQEEQP